MARRAIWKGVISFSGIRVPVKLYSAVQEQRVEFHLLHDQDHERLRQQMVCEVEDKPVGPEETVKGLEVGENEYVLVTPEELAELEPPADRTIQVDGFVQPDEIDPRFYDRAYHLGPDGEEGKYAALVQALGGAGRIGVCRWVFRRRSYVGAMRTHGQTLEVLTLRLAEEVRPTDAVEVPQAALNPREQKMARYLVDELTGPFDPSQYRNDFNDALESLIQTKAQGGKVKTARPRKPQATPSDELIGALEASLKQVRQDRPERRTARRGSPAH